MRRGLVAAACLVLCFATPVLARSRRAVASRAVPRPDWQRAYVDGINAGAKFNRWPDVADTMRYVISRHPQEEMVQYRKEPPYAYLPHFWLGYANYMLVCGRYEAPLERCGPDPAQGNAPWSVPSADDTESLKEAIDAFRQSDSQGFIRQVPSEDGVLKLLLERSEFFYGRAMLERDIQQRLQQQAAGRPPKRPSIFAVFFDRLAAPLDAFSVEHHEDIAALARGIAAIRATLRGREAESPMPPAFQPFTPERLAALKEEDSRNDVARQTQQKAEAAKGLLELAAARPDASVLGTKVKELEAAIALADSLIPAGSPADLEAATTRLDGATTDLSSALAAAKDGGTPPVDLVLGAASFFAGDYLHAVKLLDRVTVVDHRAQTQQLLLRSAARHALYLTGGESDHTLLDRAADDARACHRLSPELVPTADFSPRFRDFFAKAAANAG